MSSTSSSKSNNNYKNETAIEKAKKEFGMTVRKGLEVLMKECGYSRTRAVELLLQELLTPSLNQHDDEAVHSPSNNEVRF
jgi:hypothetical protein